MVVPKALFIYLLSSALIRNSLSVVHQSGQTPLKVNTGELEEKINKSVDSVNQLQTGLSEKITEGAKGLGNATMSVLDSFSKGFNFLNENSNKLVQTAKNLTETGVNLGSTLEKGARAPIKIVSDYASGNLDLFNNSRDFLEKKDHINNVMSDYLQKHVVELPEDKSGLMNDKYLKLYKDRCRNGDCLTLDTVTVSQMNNKVNLQLPRLAQVDYAFALFDQCGIKVNNNIINTVLRKTNYNSLDHFIHVLASHNQKNLEFLNKNDQALNLFYYKATLYYKKFILDSKFENKLDASKTLTAALGFFVKSDLIEMAQVATLNSSLTLDEDDLSKVNRNFAEYLAADSGAVEALCFAYADLCKQCLEGSYDDNEANEHMMEALNEGKVKTDDLCEDDKCNHMLDQYLERCKNGDCYTFDNISLTNNVRIKILLPHIPQAKLALRAFKNSKAHRGKHIIGFFKKLFKIDTQKTLSFFIKTLTKHNVQRNYYNNEGEKVLNQFLYQATLYFVRFLTVSRLVGFYSWCGATLWMFKVGRFGYLKNLAKTITFGNKVMLAGDNVPLLMNDFEDYLVSSNFLKHANISRYYSKMCKDVMMHYINADKMGTEMFDAGLDVTADNICGKGDKLECPSIVQKFLDRCQKGDCYTLDTKVYFTSDRMYKLTLPVLYQVEAAIYVFKKSKAYKNVRERFSGFGNGKKNVDSYVQFYRNIVTHNNKFIETKTFENEVVNKYLYNSAVYFKFVDDNKALDSADDSHLQDFKNSEYKIESFLKRMIKSLVGVERVRFSDLSIKDLFSVYKNYFLTTQIVKNDHGVKVFLSTCEKLLRHFKEMQNDDSMFKQYVKTFDNE